MSQSSPSGVQWDVLMVQNSLQWSPWHNWDPQILLSWEEISSQGFYSWPNLNWQGFWVLMQVSSSLNDIIWAVVFWKISMTASWEVVLKSGWQAWSYNDQNLWIKDSNFFSLYTFLPLDSAQIFLSHLCLSERTTGDQEFTQTWPFQS